MQKNSQIGTQILADCKIKVAQKMYGTNLSKCNNLLNKTDIDHTGTVAKFRLNSPLGLLKWFHLENESRTLF